MKYLVCALCVNLNVLCGQQNNHEGCYFSQKDRIWIY